MLRNIFAFNTNVVPWLTSMDSGNTSLSEVPSVTREWRTRLIALSIAVILLGVAAWSWANEGLVYRLLTSDTSATEKLVQLRNYFHSWGPAAPLIYFAFVVIEVVVAPIPGTMLYAPGGVVFGGFVGGTVTLLANVAGAGVSCQLVRWIGGSRLAHWYDSGKLLETGQLIDKHGLWIVLLLRLNPVTSSDLVSYAAGFTNVRLWKLMAGTLIGMAPLCYLQAFFAAELLERIPWLLYPGIALCVIYALAVILVVARLRKRSNPPTPTIER